MIQPLVWYGILIGVNVSGDETLQEIIEECQRTLIDIGSIHPSDRVTVHTQTVNDAGTYITFIHSHKGSFPQCDGVWVYYVCGTYPDKCASNHQSQHEDCADRRQTCEASALSLVHVCQIQGLTLENAYHKFIEWCGDSCHAGQYIQFTHEVNFPCGVQQ